MDKKLFTRVLSIEKLINEERITNIREQSKLWNQLSALRERESEIDKVQTQIDRTIKQYQEVENVVTRAGVGENS